MSGKKRKQEDIQVLLIKNGKIVNSDRSYKSDILVEGGKIIKIAPVIDRSDVEVIDASDKLIIPGGIDAHTHMNMPFMGTRTCDDFESGTRAAVAGGTTMLIDFIIPSKNGSLVSAFNMWKEWASKSVCDWGFHCAITWWGDLVEKEMGDLVKLGVPSFKHFMAYKGALMLDDSHLIDAFVRCKELGALASVHAENGDMVAFNQKKLMEQGVTGPEAHPISRDENVEGEACERACLYAEQVGCPLMIVHNTCGPAVDAILRSRLRGNKVLAEATICHLVLDESKYRDPDFDVASAHVLSPPLREAKNKDILWNNIKSGLIDYVITDHCSFNIQQKRAGKKNFCIIPNGIGAVEERLMLLWHFGVRTCKITPEEFVQQTSTNVAKIYNIYPQKGVIAEGSDADFSIWDPNQNRTLSSKTNQSKNDFCCFEGWKITGCPIITISRGRVVFRDGKVIAKAGDGRFVHRNPFSPYVYRERKSLLKYENR